jgi:hypothetical protein
MVTSIVVRLAPMVTPTVLDVVILGVIVIPRSQAIIKENPLGLVP